jgi:enoyl-CoA hydratase/carnithine racemase
LELSTIRYESLGPILRLVLNRPDRLNAINPQLRQELGQALRAAEADPAVRVVIITGAGRAFSAGVDIRESAERPRPQTPGQWREHLAGHIDEMLQIWNLSKPVVGAINGYALGAGCDLALATDMNVASSEARFGEPEIAFFSAPPTLLMPWVVGMKKCKELLLTGKVIDAWEAERIGIVNKVVPPEALETEALQMARDLAKVPAESLRFNKLAINQTYEIQGLLQALRYNLEASIMTYMSESTEDRAARNRFMRERGLRAFHEVGYDEAVRIGRELLAGGSEGSPGSSGTAGDEEPGR